MTVILGVVLAVMVIMNGAMFYVLRTAALTTKRQVESCFVQELEDYNDYLQEKEDENRKINEKKNSLNKEIQEMEGVVLSLKTSPFYAPRPIARELFIPTARYIDNEFFDNHKRVNDMLRDMDYQEIVDRIEEKYEYRGNLQDYSTACSLLEFLGMDMTYELSTVPPDTQLLVLRAAFQGEELKMLEAFIESLPEEEDFDVLDFRTYIREIRTAQDPRMYIRTGREELEGVEAEEGLVHQYDGNISEGLKIIYQNQSFDFSIYRLRSKK